MITVMVTGMDAERFEGLLDKLVKGALEGENTYLAIGCETAFTVELYNSDIDASYSGAEAVARLVNALAEAESDEEAQHS